MALGTVMIVKMVHFSASHSSQLNIRLIDEVDVPLYLEIFIPERLE